MDTQKSPSVREVAPAALVLALIGWVGLLWLLDSTRPTIAPRWFFFFLLALAVSGTCLPLIAYIHRRFTSDPPVQMKTIVRQALWISFYVTALTWLQIARLLNSSVAVLLGVGIFAIEWLLRVRESSRWNP